MPRNVRQTSVCRGVSQRDFYREHDDKLKFVGLLVAVEGIEPTSLDYQSSALAVELHRDLECAGIDSALDVFFESTTAV
jgi:hypothetical protein